MRYAWDNWHSYIREYKMNPILKKIGKKRLHKIRIWDRLSAERVDHFIANSSTTQKRIQKYYRKDSEVIFPMINANQYQHQRSKGYYLAVGRLTPYKKFDLLVETFNQNGLPLKIVGTGIQQRDLEMKAKENIEFLGFVNDKELNKLYSECKAFLFPQLEDFGITPLEAMACGKPVIAYGAGGALDTVVDEESGIYFHKQSPQSLKLAIDKFEKTRFDHNKIQEHAKKFDQKNFKKNILKFVEDKWREHAGL